MIMACNAASSKKSTYVKVPQSRAIAVGDSYSDPIRVAAMMVNDKSWDEVIIVGDRQGPLYDRFRTIKTPSELPKIDSFDHKKRTLIVFDECSKTERDQDITQNFFIRSRLRGVSTLFVECDLHFVPKWVRMNTDVFYFTTRPKNWNKFQQFNCFRVPLADCFAGARPNSWFKIDMRNDETKVIDATKYYP